MRLSVSGGGRSIGLLENVYKIRIALVSNVRADIGNVHVCID